MIVDASARTPDATRRINESLWRTFARENSSDPVAFFCECGKAHCYQPVWLTLEAYEGARLDASWVALADGHVPQSEAPEPLDGDLPQAWIDADAAVCGR